MDRWSGKVAVVTGASEGIGEAIVRRLAKHGMKVAALARRKPLLDEIESDVNKTISGGIVKGYVCDVTSTEDVANTFHKIEEDLGPVSVLVNNAGVLRDIKVTDIDLSDVEATVETNFMGVVKSTKAAIASMKNHSINDGHIINISSMSVYLDGTEWPQFGVYKAVKTAVNSFSNTLKNQLSIDKSRTRVTVICPGLVKTTMVNDFVGGNFSGVPHLVPEDVAASVAYALGAPTHVNVSEILINPI